MRIGLIDWAPNAWEVCCFDLPLEVLNMHGLIGWCVCSG